MKKLFQSRFAAYFGFLTFYLLFSLLVRLILMSLCFEKLNVEPLDLMQIFARGFLYDLCIALWFSLAYLLYLLIFPNAWIGTLLDKISTYTFIGIAVFVSFFSFFAEFPFWEEFGSRYNFIAVDYLIYTYEVIKNIGESYPLPLIFSLLALSIALYFFVQSKAKIFSSTFESKPFPKAKWSVFFAAIGLLGLFQVKLSNNFAEFSPNNYANELSKNGVYSFFHAYISNELSYEKFYPNLPNKQAFDLIKKELTQSNQTLSNQDVFDINRETTAENAEKRPNLIVVCIESFSADFMTEFGNSQNLTPNLDKLAKESLFFTNLYATGTRTVRGLEALSLSIPPTPGNSIVRRPNNQNLFSIATVLKQKDYRLNFIYGGDGYFDNMNNFFGGQGFDIIDRNRNNPLSDEISTQRTPIEDSDVSFENAWGICDVDIYKQALKNADQKSKNKTPFFEFIMTTSNHKPYTFPSGKIDLPSGSREAAVKYTDYAIGEFIKEAKTKPWFKNTVFLFVADHCASSAGKWEINIENHKIPALIYNSGLPSQKIDILTSQIDVIPTLFGLLNWNYKSEFYGKDIFKTDSHRALIGNYRTLGLLKDDLRTYFLLHLS
ncbi:MAG: sulfatase [Flavobacteriaceae bacterium]|nr:MAG: sulfatase [Flavobacteriaceae bacterium]